MIVTNATKYNIAWLRRSAPAHAPGHHHSPRHRSIVEALEDTTADDFGGVVSSPRAAAAERRQTAYRLPRVFTRGVDAEWEETFTKIWNL